MCKYLSINYFNKNFIKNLLIIHNSDTCENLKSFDKSQIPAFFLKK